MKLTKFLSLLLALVVIFSLAACGSQSAEDVEEIASVPNEDPAGEASGEPAAAPAAEGEIPAGEGKYTVGLIRDDVAKAELNIPSGKVVNIALDYAGKDSTVSFEITGNTDETVATAAADILTLTISGAKAGSTTVTASWCAVNTSGSTYTVEIAVTVNDDGTESFSELTTGDAGSSAEGGASAETSVSAEPAPIGGSDEPSTMEPGGILFCGSSLMGGFRVVDTFLEEDGYDVSTGNISMGGTTIADFAAAQKENIVAMDPGAIFINIGSVDVDRVASEVFDMQFMQDSYRELLTYLRDNLPECSIYVMAYYPSQENTFRPNALVDECNIWVEELANELGLNFVNVSGVLKNEKGYLREDYSSDGIHLTDEAYREVYNELKPALLAAAGLE